MSDTKTSQPAVRPDQKPTVAMPPPPPWAIELSQRVADGFERQDKRADASDDRFEGLRSEVSNMGRQLTIAVEDGKENNKRTTTLEVRFDQFEKRLEANSIRVRQPSEHDMEALAEIAAERTARQQLGTRLDGFEKKFDDYASRPDAAAVLLQRMDNIAEKPWFQKAAAKLGPVVLSVVLLALTAIGVKLKSQLDTLETKPAAVQSAQTVYVPVPVPMSVFSDGGVK